MISTGMASKKEIEAACSSIDRECNSLVLFQCVSEYPAEAKDYNLGGLHYLKDKSDFIGISDHSMNNIAVIGAVARGVTYIEKHLTIERSKGGIDSHFSLEPEEFKEMVISARQIYEACRDKDYIERNKDSSSRLYRRSLYIKPDLKSGTTIKEDHIISLRPAFGDSVDNKTYYIGKTLNVDINEITPLKKNLLRQ
jgi:N-acetylneuraminate synthase